MVLSIFFTDCKNPFTRVWKCKLEERKAGRKSKKLSSANFECVCMQSKCKSAAGVYVCVRFFGLWHLMLTLKNSRHPPPLGSKLGYDFKLKARVTGILKKWMYTLNARRIATIAIPNHTFYCTFCGTPMFFFFLLFLPLYSCSRGGQ